MTLDCTLNSMRISLNSLIGHLNAFRKKSTCFAHQRHVFCAKRKNTLITPNHTIWKSSPLMFAYIISQYCRWNSFCGTEELYLCHQCNHIMVNKKDFDRASTLLHIGLHINLIILCAAYNLFGCSDGGFIHWWVLHAYLICRLLFWFSFEINSQL